MVTGCGIDVSCTNVVASGDFTGQVFLWQNKIETPINKICFTNSVRCLLWIDNILLIGLLEGQLYQWKMCSKDCEPQEVYNFIGGVVSLKSNSKKTMLAVCTTLGYLYIFSLKVDSNNGFLIFNILYCKVQHIAKPINGQMLDMEIWSLAWSPDDNKIATASEDQTCLINDSESGKFSLIFSVLLGLTTNLILHNFFKPNHSYGEFYYLPEFLLFFL